jgi:cytochrome c-type biogenesis protein CcmH
MTAKTALALILTALVVGSTVGTVVAQEDFGADNLAIIGTPQGSPLSGTELDRVTEELTDRMRCPVCQGLSIADSGTMIALAMKEEVRQFLAAGYTEEQILLYFEASYGEFIRLEPKPTGFNLLVWIAPLVVLLLGAGVVFYRLRSKPAGPATREAVVADEKGNGDLESYRQRVRREVAS